VAIQGQKKRVLKEVIKYYTETTGSAYEDFILSVQKNRGKTSSGMGYSDWLAVKSLNLLNSHGISLADCVENKDVVRSAIMEEESRKGGEFYTPEVWCADGREYLKEMLGDEWGKAYIWDASCGTGNLMKTAGYPEDRLFMSTLLIEDVEIVKGTYPSSVVFQCDFVNGIDHDSLNKHFSDNLPAELLCVLENNEPLVFYMNPPYKVMESKKSDVGSYMCDVGLSRSASDIFHQFMYRICMLKRLYNHTNMYLGIFGPITMFHSKMIEELYNEFKRDFVFVDGMCFNAGDFSNTSESVEWVVGYTTWSTKRDGDKDRSVLLDAKTSTPDGKINNIGKKMITNVEENLHNWSFPKDVLRTEYTPVVSNMFTFRGDYTKFAENALGSMMSSNYVIRATRRAAITTLPNTDSVDITEENFWRCVASYGARRVYASKQNPYDNCQYYSKPDDTLDGYKQWLADALVVFMFDTSSYQASYRDAEFDGKLWNIKNKLFPMSEEYVRSIVTDPVIISDLDSYSAENKVFLRKIASVYDDFGVEARELFEFCMQVIVDSLVGYTRKDLGYPNSLRAWDAGFAQLRASQPYFNQKMEERYIYLLARLKDKLLDGCYKFGFLMDTYGSNEQEIDKGVF